MNWTSLLGSLSKSAPDERPLCHEYLRAENRMLRQQINDGGQLTDHDRTERAEIGAQHRPDGIDQASSRDRHLNTIQQNASSPFSGQTGIMMIYRPLSHPAR